MKTLRILVPVALVVAAGVLGVTWWLGSGDAPPSDATTTPTDVAAPSGAVPPSRTAVAPPSTAEAEVAPRRTADVAFGVAGTGFVGRAAAVGEPLVEGVCEVGLAAVVAAAGFLIPVDEIGFVIVTQQDFLAGFAVDDCGLGGPMDLLVTVDEMAGVTRFLDQAHEADQPLAGVQWDLL